MREISIDLREIVKTLAYDEEDLLKAIGAYYASEEYGIDIDDMEEELCDLDTTIDTDGDFLLNIQNTLANIDRKYGDEDEDSDYEDDYENDYDYDDCDCDCDDCDEDDEYDDDYDEDEDDIDEETRRLIEANRRKNEEALGL